MDEKELYGRMCRPWWVDDTAVMLGLFNLGVCAPLMIAATIWFMIAFSITSFYALICTSVPLWAFAVYGHLQVYKQKRYWLLKGTKGR